MHYKINQEWLYLTIDDLFIDHSIEDFFQAFYQSKKTIHLYKQNKDYLLNNSFVPSTTLLKKGDILALHCFKQDIPFIKTKMDLEIVYEDDFLIIVNKPKYMNVHPDSPSQVNTLVNGLAYYLQYQMVSLRYIHRLDYETTGLVIFTKCSLVQPLLDHELAIKEIHRYYKAYIEGKIPDTTVHQKIGKDRHNAKKMRVSSTGKEATTHFKTLQYKNNISEIECILDTGRTHQIRVHLAYLKHPIIGDPLYNPKRSKTNLALHAYKVTFKHPISQEMLTITCQSPYEYLLK